MGFFERLAFRHSDEAGADTLEQEAAPAAEGHDDTYDVELPPGLDGTALLDRLVKESRLGQMGQEWPVTMGHDAEEVLRSILAHQVTASPEGVSAGRTRRVRVHDILHGETGAYGTPEHDLLPRMRSEVGAAEGALEAFLYLIQRRLEGHSCEPLSLDESGTHNLLFSEGADAMAEAWFDAESGRVVIEARRIGGSRNYGAGDSPNVRVFGWK